MITKQQRDDLRARLPEMTKADLIDTATSLASQARSSDTKDAIIKHIMRRLDELDNREERDRLGAMTKAELLTEAGIREKYPYCRTRKSMTKHEVIREIYASIGRQEIEREREARRAATVAPTCPVCGGEVVLMIERQKSSTIKPSEYRNQFGRVYCIRDLGHKCKPTSQYTEFELDMLATGEPCRVGAFSTAVPSKHKKFDKSFDVVESERYGRRVIESRYVG